MGEAGLRERRAVARLLRFYRPETARWVRPTGVVWQLALAIEAVVTAYERTGDPSYRAALSAWLRRHHARRSNSYDDDGWYLNAWLRAYSATGDRRFLDAATAGFVDLTAGWDAECAGGLWWTKDRTYKNAITSGLFLLAAARLARVLGGDYYHEWALRSWAWFDGVGLVNAEHLVNDGLADCRNNGGTTWTYNQGVVISGLVELWGLTGSPTYVDRAHAIAAAATARLVHPGGILREPSEPHCDRDQQIFKGVLAQGLGRLCRADPDRAGELRAFLVANAESVWTRSRQPDDGLGLAWCGPVGLVTPATHASATLLLGEAARLDPEPDRIGEAQM